MATPKITSSPPTFEEWKANFLKQGYSEAQLTPAVYQTFVNNVWGAHTSTPGSMPTSGGIDLTRPDNPIMANNPVPSVITQPSVRSGTQPGINTPLNPINSPSTGPLGDGGGGIDLGPIGDIGSWLWNNILKPGAQQLTQGTGMSPAQLGMIAAALTMILRDQASQRSEQKEYGQQVMDLFTNDKGTGALEQANAAYAERAPLRSGSTGYLANRLANPTQGNIFASYLARRNAGLPPGTVSGSAFTPPVITPGAGGGATTQHGTGTDNPGPSGMNINGTSPHTDAAGEWHEPGTPGAAQDYAEAVNNGEPLPQTMPPVVNVPGTVGSTGYLPGSNSPVVGTAAPRKRR